MNNVEQIVRDLQKGLSVDVDFPCGAQLKFVPNLSFSGDSVVGVSVIGLAPSDIYISNRNFQFISELVNTI